MGLDELRATLTALPAGKCAGIHHEVYAQLFPPGEPDETARAACYEFAKSVRCSIDNRPRERTVLFVKNV
jgi:hypothetical protein